MSDKNVLLGLSIFLFLVFYSCAPTKKAAYIRTEKTINALNEPDKIIDIFQDSAYQLKPGDELYINVSTADNADNSFQSLASGVGATNLDLITFLVDDYGFIKIPYIDQIRLEGMTVKESASILESELSQYLYQPVVNIRIINSRITVLGEVNAPGVFSIHNKPINIFQALGYAGDISVFGNREKVLIIREIGGVAQKKYVDLTDESIISSVWYELKPNDIIYVEPMQRKILGTETVPWGLVTSAISTAVVIMTFILSIQLR